jgi:lipopolysaccharide export system permease protein
MSGFGLKRSDENAFGTHQKMLNILQLNESLDSLELNPDKLRDEFRFTHLKPLLLIDSALLKPAPPLSDSALIAANDPKLGILSTFPDKMRYDIISRALNTARSIKNYTDYTVTRISEEELLQREFRIELHSRFMLPITCLIFLYIGAPLGAIIRKGGVGMPMVVSVCFFIFFWFLMMQGNKLAKEGILDPWAGIWLPVYVLVPIAFWITWKASVDSPIFDASSYSIWIQKIKRKFSSQSEAAVA